MGKLPEKIIEKLAENGAIIEGPKNDIRIITFDSNCEVFLEFIIWLCYNFIDFHCICIDNIRHAIIF